MVRLRLAVDPEFVISGFPNFPLSCLPEKQKSLSAAYVTRPRGLGRVAGECWMAHREDNRPADDGATDSENKSLNFKVSLEFKKEFKGFAGSQGITMTDLLKEGFLLSKKKRQK